MGKNASRTTGGKQLGQGKRKSFLAPPLQQIDRTCVLFEGESLAYFGGCDYFRLASHPEVQGAIADGIEKYGLNPAASRLTTGNHVLYETLEERLAEFFSAESAVLVSNGYMSNLVVAESLAGEFSHVLIDERSHSSLLSAATILRGRLVKFSGLKHLAGILRRCGQSSRCILLTEGMFSHDGQIAPLRDYLQLLPESGRLLLDDAHGVGTLGETGQGTLELLGLPPRQVVRTITLSKAFGVYGGAVLGPRSLPSAIHKRSPMFIGNTPLPLPLAHAALASLDIMKSDSLMRRRLWQNTRLIKDPLIAAGFQVADNSAPIISLAPKSPREINDLRRALLNQGIFPSHIRYPGGPGRGYFRFAISSEHSSQQLADLLGVLLRKARAEHFDRFTKTL